MDKKRFLQCMKDLKQFCGEIDNLNNVLGMIAPGAFSEFGYKFIDSYTQLFSESLGDKGDWVSWFIWENEWGKDKKEAGYDGKMQKIKTLDDLWNLIQDGKRAN